MPLVSVAHAARNICLTVILHELSNRWNIWISQTLIGPVNASIHSCYENIMVKSRRYIGVVITWKRKDIMRK